MTKFVSTSSAKFVQLMDTDGEGSERGRSEDLEPEKREGDIHTSCHPLRVTSQSSPSRSPSCFPFMSVLSGVKGCEPKPWPDSPGPEDLNHPQLPLFTSLDTTRKKSGEKREGEFSCGLKEGESLSEKSGLCGPEAKMK
ncbi:Hypothetical protein NTJ_15564 [Nesidiocoris tenuis]|uniref:Uncharacterized protein n=1 Tax=Nesidiocoris tenuis TaxID=355587 RepID=A0ABN7BEE8_9HEMI|nr:Hypothetical protein NTJ_15564 [Nesidiocoris tenuis]